MTPQQKTLVQMTWRAITPMADSVALLFYLRLFHLAPETQALFAKVEPDAQRQKLIAAMTTVVDGLDRLEKLVPILSELGMRHATYGVQDGHYDAVGGALLWALEGVLSELWSNEVKSAWSSAYDTAAQVMRASAGTSGPGIAQHSSDQPGRATI